jgi:hypothetical protein
MTVLEEKAVPEAPGVHDGAGRADFGKFIDPTEEFWVPPVFGFDEDRASSSPLSPWGEQFEFTRVDVVSVVIERQGVESNHVVVWSDDSLDRAVDSHVGNAVEAAHRGSP